MSLVASPAVEGSALDHLAQHRGSAAAGGGRDVDGGAAGGDGGRGMARLVAPLLGDDRSRWGCEAKAIEALAPAQGTRAALLSPTGVHAVPLEPVMPSAASGAVTGAAQRPFKVSDTAVYMHEIDDGFFEPEPELEDVQVAQGRVDAEEDVEEMARELEQA